MHSLLLLLFICLALDCKTVRIFAYSSTREQSKAENRERDWGETLFLSRGRVRLARIRTLTPRVTDFFTDFEEKTDCFAV